MAILRSPFAHANITKLDVSGALQQPNVVAAYGADELGDLNGSVPCVWPVTDDIVMPDFPSLAKGKVRHVGDCVAVVLATDAKHAADALEAIDVDYEPLDAIVDMESALAPDSPALHEEAGTNKCYVYNLGGGYDDAKAKADVVVKRRFINQRLIPTFNGAPVRGRGTHGHERRDNGLVIDADSSHPARPHRARDGNPREQPAHHRSRRGRADSAGNSRFTAKKSLSPR